MAVPVEESVLKALRGHLTESTKLPAPLIVKIFVASTKKEFQEERRVLLEQVGPSLQSLYDDRQIEIEMVDMHFGTGSDCPIVDLDPFLYDDHLMEIDICHRHSKSVFFISLVGDDLGHINVPTHLGKAAFDTLLHHASPDDAKVLREWYTLDDDVCYQLKADFKKTHTRKQWMDSVKLIKTAVHDCVEKALAQSPQLDKEVLKSLEKLGRTVLEKQIRRALELSSKKMLVVFRQWSHHNEGEEEEAAATAVADSTTSRGKVQEFQSYLSSCLPAENNLTLCVDSESCDIDPDNEAHELYLNKLKREISTRLHDIIDIDLAKDPDCVKGRKKTVQEIFHEHSTHLRFQKEHQMTNSLISSTVSDKMKQRIIQNYRSGANTRHSPYFIFGDHGCGKTSLICDLYKQVTEWFTNTKVHRVIRFAAATPRSSYNLELLRVICQQISIIFHIPEGYLPKDASFDPLYINNWFQNLLKRCEETQNEIFFLFIDDLHKLNPLDCDIVAALSWFPISLPRNVFLICSTAVSTEALKFSPVQKERFRNSDCFYDLTSDINKTTVMKAVEGEPFVAYIERLFDELEVDVGVKGFKRLACYLTCSEYGLTETELLELLMPIQYSDAFIDTHNGEFNFSSFRKVRNQMEPLIRNKMMSGKVLIHWRHSLCAELTRTRYMTDKDSIRDMHVEIANIFFNPDGDDSDDSSNEQDSQGENKDNDEEKAYMPPGSDVSYSVRHVEESWHHLMKSEDTTKFKQIAVCNFDFLLAAVQTVSISYLRCLIEHVRCYILDRDIELIYYTIRKSSDVLTRDPMQLGAQLISWLRPIAEHDEKDNSLLSITVRSATAWCDGYTVPLLVPLTGWLPVPLPSQIRTLTVSGTGPIRCICLGPTKQHLLISSKTGDVQLWHIMSNSLVHTFKGHTAPITCMRVMRGEEPLLITGSDDMAVIVWDMKTYEMKHRLCEHSAAVLCVASALNNTLIISGGADGRINISSSKGDIISRIDHHRGPVSAIQISQCSDVLVSASHDATICLWSLENFSLLNLIKMPKPVLNLEISCDSVFLLAHLEDNGLYLRSLATGTELHTLRGHKSKVRDIAIAMDGQRAIVGCDDARALIFDMSNGKLIRSFPPNPGPVTALHVMEDDDFLITAGGNKITFYSFRNEELNLHHMKSKKFRTMKRMFSQRRNSIMANATPITCFDVSRDSQVTAIAYNKSVQIWSINTPEYKCTLDNHNGPVTCVKFSPNCEFLVSGSEDKTVVIWRMNLGVIGKTFEGHNMPITCVYVMMDSRRVVSADREGFLCVWLADSAVLLQSVQGPFKMLTVTNNMKFAVCTNRDNSLRIWSLTQEDVKYNVSHADEITCFEITADSLFIITGSRDMSLKVWQANGGKLAQVLVGHSDAVNCVAVSVTNKTQVISGSKDTNLIIWDIHTGEEIHTLAGHLGAVSCVKVSADGTTAVSGSDDKTLIVWETKRGLALTSLQLHVQFQNFDITLECSRILVHLMDTPSLPIICLHNTPASFVKLPTYSAPVEDLRPIGPKKQMRRLLKKEVSLDTYTWQKKYGHLTSSVMMAQVDERLKRRFSVSASMEEISKIAEMKTLQSKESIGPEQAALAQSQHFDQLEALWNKRSPPRRRYNASLSRQSSLAEDRIDSSEEDEFMEERADTID